MSDDVDWGEYGTCPQDNAQRGQPCTTRRMIRGLMVDDPMRFPHHARPRVPKSETDPHAYQTTAPPGVRNLGGAYEVVGVNGRRLLVAETPDGVWLGSVLLAGPGALLNLADLLRGYAVDDSGQGGR